MPATRVPLLAGTRVVVADAPDDAVVLRPPPPLDGIVDVGAAVRDALRFPLAGRSLEALATRGGRATIVVEPPSLPIPSSERDPREDAIAATCDELVRIGVASERQTLLVAGGLGRRPGAARGRGARLAAVRPPLPRPRWRSTTSSATDLVALGSVGRDARCA